MTAMMRDSDEQQTLEHELAAFFDALSDECKEAKRCDAKIKSEQKRRAEIARSRGHGAPAGHPY